MQHVPQVRKKVLFDSPVCTPSISPVVSPVRTKNAQPDAVAVGVADEIKDAFAESKLKHNPKLEAKTVETAAITGDKWSKTLTSVSIKPVPIGRPAVWDGKLQRAV